MKAKKIVILLAVAAAVAASTASWKWNTKVGQTYTPDKIAGWSWSDSWTAPEMSPAD